MIASTTWSKYKRVVVTARVYSLTARRSASVAYGRLNMAGSLGAHRTLSHNHHNNDNKQLSHGNDEIITIALYYLE